LTESTHLQSPEVTRIEEVVTQYLAETRRWRAGEFRIEPRGVSKDGACIVVWAIHRDDETRPAPGAGKSLELHVHRTDYRVLKEFKFQ
jgi:hypothetical protein